MTINITIDGHTITITTRETKRKGTAFDMYVRYQGVRHRPSLGYNLAEEEAVAEAMSILTKIKAGVVASDSCPQANEEPRFRDIVSLYWDTFEMMGRVDRDRPQGIITNQLLPEFGDLLLSELDADCGLRYVLRRQHEGKAAGTIQKEWQLLMRILNLAVEHEKTGRNRLQRIKIPKGTMRERVAETWELRAIRSVATPEVWRLAMVALHTGRREGKILEIDAQWFQHRSDGYWLSLPPSRTQIKRNPRFIPLNDIAVKSLMGDVPSVPGSRVFRQWGSTAAAHTAWSTACRRAHVVDLHVQDLRHTFATWLQGCGVDYEVRQHLLGHKMKGTTARYSHGDVYGDMGWDATLREAVARLHTAVLSYGLSYEKPRRDTKRVVVSDNELKTKEKKWRPQGDLNPCRRRERAVS